MLRSTAFFGALLPSLNIYTGGMLEARITIENSGSLQQIAQEAKDCRNCDLWRHATQTVFGEGSTNAKIMLIGEQPGNEEDQQGRPFVGPAGRLMDRLLSEAGLDRRSVYVTNVVKHFKWEPRGKRRIHKRPATGRRIVRPATPPFIGVRVIC
jgi:uracil-DNA glycosylase family protein